MLLKGESWIKAGHTFGLDRLTFDGGRSKTEKISKLVSQEGGFVRLAGWKASGRRTVCYYKPHSGWVGGSPHPPTHHSLPEDGSVPPPPPTRVQYQELIVQRGMLSYVRPLVVYRVQQLSLHCNALVTAGPSEPAGPHYSLLTGLGRSHPLSPPTDPPFPPTALSTPSFCPHRTMLLDLCRYS